jgi:hypothetical protein
MGPFSSVVRQLLAIAHLRDSDWLGTGQSARLAIGNQRSARSMKKTLSGIEASLVRVRARQRGRPATVFLAPDLTREHACVEVFEPGRWMPVLLSSSIKVRRSQTGGLLREKNSSDLRKSG